MVTTCAARRGVDDIDEGGQGGGLAAAGGAGDQHQALAALGQLRRATGGRCSDSSDGMREGSSRMLAASVPRWWWMLTRKRPRFSRTKLRSTDFFFCNSSSCQGSSSGRTMAA